MPVKKAIFVFSLAVAVLAVGLGAKEKPVDSTWAESPPRIDGAATEWDPAAMVHQKKMNIDYAFRNDGERLYILVAFKERKYLSSIAQTGMTLWFNAEGKKKKKYGLRFFPRKITADEYIALLEGQGKQVPEEQKARIRQNPSYLLFDYEMIKEKEVKSSGESASDPKNVPVYRNTAGKQGAVYEFSVPLAKIAELAAGIGAEPGKIIQVGFEWGGATEEMKRAIASRLAAGDTSARAGRATGNLRSERRVYDSSGGLERMRRSLPKKYDFWVAVSLAHNE